MVQYSPFVYAENIVMVRGSPFICRENILMVKYSPSIYRENILTQKQHDLKTEGACTGRRKPLLFDGTNITLQCRFASRRRRAARDDPRKSGQAQ